VPQLVQEIVLSAFKDYPLGAVNLQELIKRSYGVSIPHNTIHKILRGNGLAVSQDSKKRRRKWVRFERHKSNSLWQGDWTKLGDKWLVSFMDDASRVIVGYGLYSNATAENSAEVLEKAIEKYGKPKALLTGHDTQFVTTDEKKLGEQHAFQKALKKHGIKHILARVSHPQTCGKIERFFGEVKQRLHHFRDLDHFMYWYNEVKPHMSLKWDELETPAQAFRRKASKEIKASMEVKIRALESSRET